MTRLEWATVPGPRHELAEEPTFDPAGDRIVWVDVPRGEIWSRPAGDDAASATLLHRLDPPISAARPVGEGVLVASRMDLLVLGNDGGKTMLATIPRDPLRWQVNGLVVRPDGSVLAGLLSRDRSEIGELVLVEAGETTRVVADVQAANGLCLDPASGDVWQVDTYARTLTRYTADTFDGTLVTRFDGLPGRPDGACVTDDGDLWVAMWDGAAVVRIDAGCTVLDVLQTPVSRPTCPLFVGNRLYVTTAASPSRSSLDGRLIHSALDPQQ
ncbi:MAG: SMP-30/gluconolactonase/LRE family protein [Jatrophihabitans sp.]